MAQNMIVKMANTRSLETVVRFDVVEEEGERERERMNLKTQLD